MFDTILAVDEWICTLINQTWTHPLFDRVFSFVSNKNYTTVPIILLMAWIWIKGRTRERVAIVLSVCSIILGDLIGEFIKQLVDRPRPYLNPNLIDTIRVLGGKSTNSPSFPSNHAINCWAMALPIFIYCRHNFKWITMILICFAITVCYSRIYLGVHYLSDVVGGTLIGTLTACFLCWINRAFHLCEHAPETGKLRWGWAGIAIIIMILLTGIRISFISDRNIDLSFEEAQYWDWSRHPALGYFSKPPMVAWIIYLFTGLVGCTNTICVRMPSLVISVILIYFLWRFLRHIGTSSRTCFIAFVVACCMPLFAAGSVLITTDTPLLLGWVLALLALWNALYGNSRQTLYWVLCGFFMGFGLLSKYSMFYFHGCLFLMLLFVPELRGQLKRKGVWIAIAISLLMLLPPLYWNWQHDWVSYHHVASDATDRGHIGFYPLYFFDFLGSQTGVAGPGVFLGSLYLAWRLRKQLTRDMKFLLWFALPIILVFTLKSFTSKVQGNWIAMVYPSLVIFVVLAWEYVQTSPNFTARFKRVTKWLGIASLLIGAPMTFAVYYPLSVFDMAGDFLRTQPQEDLVNSQEPKKTIPDSLGRSIQSIAKPLLGWHELGRMASDTLKTMPQPDKTFIFTTSYQWAAELAFYCDGNPQTYVCEGTRRSQYDIWGGAEQALGHDVLLVTGRRLYDLMPQTLAAFERVDAIGPINIYFHDFRVQTFYLYKCYNMLTLPPANENCF